MKTILKTITFKFPLWGLGGFLLLLLVGCTKENNDPYAKLPPITQTGANTFGCIVNNQVFVPRTGLMGSDGYIPKGILVLGDASGNNQYVELEIDDNRVGKPMSQIIIHLQGLDQLGPGDYVWDITNLQTGIDGYAHNYAFALVYVESFNDWRYYGSYLNSGKVTITRYDFNNRIVSGTFSGKLRNGTDEIEIKSGRFDLKWSTVSSVYFP